MSAAAQTGGSHPGGGPPPGSRTGAPPPRGGRAVGAAPAGAAAAHPSGDERFKMLDATMKRHRFAADALIEVLHTAQQLFGFLSLDLLYYVAHGLKLPPSRVYGVASFYHFFTFAPKGAHTCVVCTGTACYVKGADAVLGAAERRLGVVAGQTTPDGKVSLLTARCLGACGLAPVAVFDGVVAGRQSPEEARGRLEGWLDDGTR